MPAVYPNEGLPILTDQLWRAAAAPVVPWEFFLFANDLTPDQDTVAADVVLATFVGYSGVQITRSVWLAASVVADKGSTQYGASPIVWTCTGDAEVIYGYGIIDPASNKLLLIERWAAAVDLSVQPLVGVLPRTTDTTEPE